MRDARTEQLMDARDDEIDRCWHLVTTLQPCECGASMVQIEPCVIECPECGNVAAALSWDDASAEWNRLHGGAGTPPSVEGWV